MMRMRTRAVVERPLPGSPPFCNGPTRTRATRYTPRRHVSRWSTVGGDTRTNTRSKETKVVKKITFLRCDKPFSTRRLLAVTMETSPMQAGFLLTAQLQHHPLPSTFYFRGLPPIKLNISQLSDGVLLFYLALLFSPSWHSSRKHRPIACVVNHTT